MSIYWDMVRLPECNNARAIENAIQACKRQCAKHSLKLAEIKSITHQRINRLDCDEYIFKVDLIDGQSDFDDIEKQYKTFPIKELN